jgi:hypothetical protein
MKKPVIIIVALVIAIAGCKVDSSGLPGGATASNASLLLGKWYLKSQATVGTAFGLSVSGNETDFTSQDFYIYNKDQTVAYSEITAGNGTGTGSYTYNASTQQLTLIDPTSQTTAAYTVLKLTADSLVYSFNLSVPALGTQQLITSHLAHK